MNFRSGAYGLALALALGAMLGGCATFSARTEAMRRDFENSDYAGAEAAVDALIAKEAGVPVALVSSSIGLAPSIDPKRGQVLVLLLEKGTLRLARGDSVGAVRIFRVCRDRMDDNYLKDTGKFISDFSSILLDDTVRPYRAADYELIMVRVMLTLADLVDGGGDAYAYAAQVGIKQEEIIGSPLGELESGEGYKPREHYRRVGVGAYLQGVIREDELEIDEAERAYKRALTFEGGSHPVYGPELQRLEKGAMPEGKGALYVFDLAGAGPHLVENKANPTTEAVKLAGLLLLILNEKFSVITQAPVPVPMVVPGGPPPGALAVRSDDGAMEGTEKALDVTEVASEQLQANMPWIVARALARRTVKAIGSEALGSAVASGVKGRGRGGEKELIKDIVTIAASAVSTGFENADTRSWTTLPAEIRTARLELAAGEHLVRFGSKSVPVNITPGRASYALVFRTSPAVPPVVLVDPHSRL